MIGASSWIVAMTTDAFHLQLTPDNNIKANSALNNSSPGVPELVSHPFGWHIYHYGYQTDRQTDNGNNEAQMVDVNTHICNY